MGIDSDDLVRLAFSMVGVQEQGGDNKGPWVEEFQRAVDGVAAGEPWCMSFIQWLVQKIEDANGVKSELFKSEHCMTTWEKTDPFLRLNAPAPGCLIFWQVHKQGKPQRSGHVELVTEVLDNGWVRTIGGNTGSKDQREGDGVYEKTRNIYHDMGTLRPIGFLNIFVED